MRFAMSLLPLNSKEFKIILAVRLGLKRQRSTMLTHPRGELQCLPGI